MFGNTFHLVVLLMDRVPFDLPCPVQLSLDKCVARSRGQAGSSNYVVQIFYPNFVSNTLSPCESVCSDHYQVLICERGNFIQTSHPDCAQLHVTFLR